MPAWLLSMLIELAIKIGVPALIKYVPWIPQEVVAIINSLLEQLNNPKVSNSMAKKSARAKIRKALQVTPDVGDTKGL